jgi:CDP-diacylglycerol--glycerol-3-phosphate 3-phosphatidyltransferase
VKLLGALEKPFYATVNPLVERLIRAGVRPNTITTVGTGLVLASAAAYGFGHVRLGGLILLLSGIADTLDGQVARGGAMVTKFGAFYDSTLDRVGDGATFIGIGAYLLMAPDVAYRIPAVILCMVAILSSLRVSYARARAEGLGLDCKVGIAQRAERILGLGSPRSSSGPGRGRWCSRHRRGARGRLHDHRGQRFVYVYRNADRVTAEPRARSREHATLDPLAKGR